MSTYARKLSNKSRGAFELPAVDGFEILAIIFIFLALVNILYFIFLRYATDPFVWLRTFLTSVEPYLQPTWNILSWISRAVVALCVFGVVYAWNELQKLNKSEAAKLYPEKTVEPIVQVSQPVVNHKWERIMGHIKSENPSDWRIAILEADIMLEEMIDNMGYHGENLGAKLKSIEKSDFSSIDAAWEAHKVRNMLAHEGGEFAITQREARRIIELYRQVFEEFRYI